MSEVGAVDVTPPVLEWARTSAGLSREEAAEKAQLQTARLASIEKGTARPSWPELKRLAHVYRRSPAVLLLPVPPDEPGLPKYFRSAQVEAKAAVKLSPETISAIRRARQLQQALAELRQDAPRATKPLPKATITDSPEATAAKVRELLRLSDEPLVQRRVREPRDLFREYRSTLFDYGVLVLQLSMPPEEVRGFSLLNGPDPTLVVSQSDSPTARCFTLLHELGHALLRDGGICEISFRSPVVARNPEERFCNAFAGNFLLPRGEIMEASRELAAGEPVNSVLVQRLGHRYGVSREVVLRRLLDVGGIAPQQYRDALSDVYASYDLSQPEKRGGADYVRVAFSQYGHRFANEVLGAVDGGRITYRDAVAYLGLRVDYFDRVREFIDHASGRRGDD
ncbi:MAG: XRE family transcriptional regulator [Thermoplasmata archaeon]|nr:XRE family transcriptional regulator [Thermoplasmata archaeon]